MHSMTGYGLAKCEKENVKIIVEAKSVNHRFLECSIRLPHSFLFLEEQIRKTVKAALYRGKVDLFISIEGEGLLTRSLVIDVELLKKYKEAASMIQSVTGDTSPLDVNAFLQNEKVVTIVEKETDTLQLVKTLIVEVVETCMERLSQMREEEGAFLQKDIEQVLIEMERVVTSVEKSAPDMTKHYRERLEKRMRSLINHNDIIDDGRILTEVAIFAERVDVSEELVRLRAHIEQFRRICAEERSTGRKLDFLVQEMNRETNTIGSKANDTAIRQYVVELKSFIERLKEQVQNIE